jgi:hypothetical protein
MEFIAPMDGLLFEERLKLTDAGLTQIDNIHEGRNQRSRYRA